MVHAVLEPVAKLADGNRPDPQFRLHGSQGEHAASSADAMPGVRRQVPRPLARRPVVVVPVGGDRGRQSECMPADGAREPGACEDTGTHERDRSGLIC